MSTYTVSGNTVSGNTPSLPGTVTNNNYTIDTTVFCDLLAALLNEEVKQNETLSQLNETITAYIKSLTESGLLDSLQGQVLVEDLETEINTEEDTGSVYREQLLSLLESINGSLSGSQDILDSMNKTVSGNNTVLNDLDGTVASFQDTYTEQAEAGKDIECYKLSTGFSILFALSLLAGIVLSMIAWHKMR